jgi:hypothetical protein
MNVKNDKTSDIYDNKKSTGKTIYFTIYFAALSKITYHPGDELMNVTPAVHIPTCGHAEVNKEGGN